MAQNTAKSPSLEVRSTVQKTDTDVVIVFQDTSKKALPPRGPYSSTVEKLKKAKVFDASHGSMQFLRFGGKRNAENVLLVGFGSASDLTEEKARIAGARAWSRLSQEKSRSISVHVDSMTEARGLSNQTDSIRIIRSFAEGMLLASYKWEKFKTAKKSSSSDQNSSSAKITLLVRDKSTQSLLDKETKAVRAVQDAITVARNWSNEPSNEGTPEYFASEARKLARSFGLKCTVLTERDAQRENMGLFLGVGRGSEREGRIVVLEYTPKTAVRNAKTVVLVGKGITFDSGGISLKPPARMEEMKHDMSGAATVMGAILLASRWQVKNKVIAVMGFTENMPSGTAIQPGNILVSRSGKTVEVTNTDAEGRLILADLLDYAQKFKPDALIDVATLTGAVLVALGKQCTGIMGNNDELISKLKEAGEVHSERVWQLPLWDEYFEDMKSPTADLKNAANDPYGGTIRGGVFLKQFVKDEIPWAHLDIAATGWGMGHLPYYPKNGASGMHVRTLAQFSADFSE